tara:strand:- start:280 stop:1128 length:849 start_codon:yes stop_codon:yes gene_type:complete
MNVIGIGSVGCAMVEQLKQYPQYNVYKIDHDLKGLKKNGEYNFPRFDEVEEYESRCPTMKNFLKNVNGETTLFVSGQDSLCAATLRILETIRSRTKISIIYFKPDSDLTSAETRLMDNAAFNIFQEYARSGMFDRIYIVSQDLLESAVGDVSILEFENKTAELVSFMFHIVNVMRNSDPVYDNFTSEIDIARISTFGMASTEESEETLLYPLSYAKEKTYYYLIPESSLQKDTKLMKKITNHVKKRTEHGKIKINFGVYQSEYPDPFVYVVSSSSMIQGADL